MSFRRIHPLKQAAQPPRKTRPVDVAPGPTEAEILEAKKASAYRGFHPTDLAFIHRALDKCNYRKQYEKLADQTHGFSASIENDGKKHTLRHYNQFFESGPEYEGVCHELAFRMVHMLNRRLGRSYTFSVVNGNCPEFFSTPSSNHVFLMAWPVWKDRDMQQALKDNPKSFPENGLIIDPSFKKLGCPAELPGYTMREIIPTDKPWNRDMEVQFPSHGYSIPYPLSYLGQMTSDVPSDMNPKSLVYLCLSNFAPYARLVLQKPEDELVNGDFSTHYRLTQLLPKGHPALTLLDIIKDGVNPEK